MNYVSIFIYIIIILIKFSKGNDRKEYKYISLDFYSKYPLKEGNNYFNENITNNYLFSKIKFGSKEQEIEMKLDLDNYQTYILKINFVDKRYIPFDTNNSKTFKTFKRFYTKNNEFSSGLLALDDLNINNSSNNIKINDFYFAYIDNGYKTFPGSIGFSCFRKELYPQKTMNFIEQLKNKSLIENDNFAFIFDTNNNNNYKGKIYIGEDLSQIIPDELTKYEKAIIKLSNRGYNEEGISALIIYEVHLGNYSYKIDTINNNNIHKKVEAQFDLKYDFIIATDEYSNMIYKIFFKNLFSSLKCFRENFVYYSYFYAIKCEKSIDIKSFPDLIFDFASEFEKVNLILDYNDLFELKGDFFYFKIILTWSPEEGININGNWIFGKEFFRKFLINFNVERKDITLYYIKKEKNEIVEEENNNEKGRHIFWILILIMIIMSGIIIFLFVRAIKLKKLVKTRNRLNILEVEMIENKENKNT